MSTPFSPAEHERYARHIVLKEIGGPGQQALKAATVAIIGMGGLGAPAALYLAAAGVGALRLIDDDVVSLSNLQRQILYRTHEVGAPKVKRASEALGALNPHVALDARKTRLASDNAESLLAGAHVVLDGSDSFATRFAVNAACHKLGATLVSGAVGRWDGQLAVFKSGATKHLSQDERLPCYRCFVPEAPETEEACAQLGIVGALTGIVGAMMALEAIKEIAGAGDSLAGRLLIYEGLTATPRLLRLVRDPACPTCGA